MNYLPKLPEDFLNRCCWRHSSSLDKPVCLAVIFVFMAFCAFGFLECLIHICSYISEKLTKFGHLKMPTKRKSMSPLVKNTNRWQTEPVGTHWSVLLWRRILWSGDGRLSAREKSPSLPLLSASLFGRVNSKDASLPLYFCPGQNGSNWPVDKLAGINGTSENIIEN